MQRRPVVLLIVAACAAMLASWCLAGGAGNVAAQGNGPEPASGAPATDHIVSLQYGDIDTRAVKPSVPEPFSIDGYPSDAVGYYLVQYAGPILAEWRAATEAAGARIVGYVPYNTYVLAATGQQMDVLRARSEVQWIGIYQPAYRVAPALQASWEEGDQILSVLTFDKADATAVRTAVEATGGEVLAEDDSETRALLKVRVHQAALASVARVNGVAWIEPWVAPQLANSEARSIMDVEDTVWAVNGLRGAGQVIAIADTGLDVGSNDASMNDDFEGRIDATFAYGRSGDWSDPNGHGTHVAGSALGSGRNSGSNPDSHSYAGSQAGVAPEAHLVFQSTEAADGSLSGLNALASVFTDAYNTGARVHSNSWGAPVNGSYDNRASLVDEFAWNHPDMAIVFAAGNEGVDQNQDGVVDLDSVDSPGVAKNVLTVGATENSRATAGYDPSGMCSTWFDCSGFSVDPIRSDAVSDDPNGMAAFSSRGPVDRNRIKPDVVAPGVNILSVRSRRYTHVMDAESGAGGWTSNGWTITDTIGYNSAHSWTTGAYPNNADLAFTSPEIDIRTGADVVTYWTRFGLNTGDSGRVEYLHGSSWRTCDTVTGNTSSWTFHTCRLPVWQMSLGDLEHFRVRFRLLSNGSGSGTGWFVDLVRVTGRAWGFDNASGTPSDDYIYMSGTSMATPLVSGAAALTREAYVSRGHEPSAALVRATLVNGAINIAPGQYGGGATQEIPNGVPNNVAGWGRVNVQASLAPEAPTVILYKDISNARGLQTNTTQVYRYEVRNNSAPFRVTLVWLDHWGLPSSAATSLSNDLDLEVVRPDKTRLWPNGRSDADTVNNTEDVFIAANTVQTGVYEITVRGRAVAFGPQGYALVVRGGNLRELPRIAVNPRQFDDMGKVLDTMGYPWQAIPDSDFTQLSKIQPYEVLFANCSSSAFNTGPSAANSLKQFVANGGALYASDWAYTYIKSAFPGYISFAAEPRIGAAQTVVARITDPGLANYLDPTNPPSTVSLNYNLSEWAVISDVAQETKVYLRGAVKTSQGTFSDRPLLVSFVPPGTNAGRVTYTTFHNEAQLSAIEKKLLEYLVLVPSTSQLATQAEQVIKDAGLKVKQTNLNTINPGQTTARFSYKLPANSPLMFVLNWGGSTLRLSVYRPDGSLYRQAESGSPPLVVSIPDAVAGTWQYQITAVSVPSSNYPYVLAIGDQAPVGNERLYLPLVMRESSQLVQGWQRAQGSAGRSVLKIAAADAACGTVLAGTDSGVMRSFDGGVTWSFANQPATAGVALQSDGAPIYDAALRGSAAMVTAVAVCRSAPGVVYVGTWGAGVYRSLDSGASWTRTSNGLTDGWIYDLAVAPATCSTVYAATSSGGVFKTGDSGANWTAQNAGLSELKTHVLALAKADSNRVYVGTTAGVFVSSDGAGSWRSTAALPSGAVQALAVGEWDAASVYAGGEYPGLMMSADAGWNWQVTSLLSLAVRSLALHGSLVYAGLDSGGVYRSADGASSWQAYSSSLPKLPVKSLLWNGGACNTLFAGTTDGIWYRADSAGD